MVPHISTIIACALLLAQPHLAAATDEEVAARERVLEMAGAFSNAGYKMRDGNWAGVLQPGQPQRVQVNLYAGNDYWFSVGATPGAKKLQVTIFDEDGNPVEIEPYQHGTAAAAGFGPTASGPYFVEVVELEGEPANFCLIYSYR